MWTNRKPDSGFELGIDLLYKYGNGNNEKVVYKGAYADGMNHNVWKQDSNKLTFWSLTFGF